MPVNDIIKEADYNGIRNKLINVISTGSSNSGWGQALRSSAVAVGNTVSVNEWGNLRYDIINAYKHIYGSAPTTAQPSLGNTVRYSNTFVPDTTTDAPNTQYDNYTNTIVANRLTVHTSQSATVSLAQTSTAWPGVYGSSWSSKIQSTVTATWPSSEAARFFFNSGGEMRFSSSRSGGSSTQQCLAWTNLLNTASTRTFSASTPGTGTTPADGLNWFRLTNSYQVWYSVTSSTPYGGNSYRISARTPAVANNSNGTAASVDFLIEYIDNYIDPGTSPVPPDNYTPPASDFPPGDLVDGTFSLSVSYLYAVGVLEPPGLGNFTITQPSVSVGTIAPA